MVEKIQRKVFIAETEYSCEITYPHRTQCSYYIIGLFCHRRTFSRACTANPFSRPKEREWEKRKKKVKITCRWIESTEKRAHNETAHFLLLRFCSLIAFWTNGKFAINCVLRWECYLCSQWTVKHKEWQRNFNRMNISNRTTILSI